MVDLHIPRSHNLTYNIWAPEKDSPMPITRQVALLMRVNKDYDRQIIAGISEYAGENHWSVYLEDEPHERIPRQSQWFETAA